MCFGRQRGHTGRSGPAAFPVGADRGDRTFKNGSGRLELADTIFSDAAPLAARVMVNRVWDWHFGRPLVPTPSDFGVQGEKPTHPELLDDLGGALHRARLVPEVAESRDHAFGRYQQSSRPREDAAKIDADECLIWRMNPRRLDIESYRDTLLRACGRLNETMYGPSEDLRVGRQRAAHRLRPSEPQPTE